MESEHSYLLDAGGNNLIRKAFLRKVCEAYSVDPEDAKLIKSDASLVFDCGDRFIKFTDARFTSQEDYELQFEWLKHLHANDVKVVELIQTTKGKNLIHRWNEEKKKGLNIVCFKKINGAKLMNNTWSKEHFITLGQISSKLHQVSQNTTDIDFSKYKNWDNHYFFDCIDTLPEDKRGLKKLFQKLLKEFKTYSTDQSIFGLVHYDISAGNYFMDDDGEIILYDFDMLCNSWYAADIAVILFYAKFYRKTRNYENFEQIFLHYFLHGYKEHRKISGEEKEKIRKFLLYRYIAVLGNLHRFGTKEQREVTFKDYLGFIEISIKHYRGLVGL